jgi:hypothetical protein
MITPARVIEQLRRRGHRVTARQLTDWRAKGLLPLLVQQGRGRGPGANYFWWEPDIVDHAATVCELLDRRARIETALLGTWFAGFKIDIARVRKAWLARLIRAQSSIEREASRRGELEDLLGGWSLRLAKNQARSVGLPYRDLDDLLLVVLNTVFDPNYRFVLADNLDLIEIANRFLWSTTSAQSNFAPLTAESFERTFTFVREKLSLTSIQKLVSSASDDELADAHRRWLACMNAVGWLVKATASGKLTNDLGDFGKRIAIAFGPYCVLVLLYLARHGTGPMMDATIELLDEFDHRVSGSGAWLEKMQRTGGGTDADDFPRERFAEIWRSFDYSCLFELNARPAS